jgi:hypothetical protein
MTKDFVLYLSTRSLVLERHAELQAARDLGLGLVVAGPQPSLYQDQAIDHFITTPTHDFAEAQRRIIGYLRQHDLQPRGIVAWTDMEVELVALLGEALQLPLTSKAAAGNVRNKVASRRLLDRFSSFNPRYAVLGSGDELDEETLRRVGVPALLKPSGASGGRGIFEITSHERAPETFRAFRAHCTPTRDLIYTFFADKHLLEQKVVGSEHSVSGLVARGQVSIFAITDKRVDPDVPLNYQTVLPSTLAPQDQQRIADVARAAVEAHGITECGFHVDMMLTDAGPKVLEVGGRFGGECINSHLIPIATGGTVKPYERLLGLFRTGAGAPARQDLRADAVRRTAFRHILPPGPGRITRLDGLEELAHHPNVRELHQAYRVGDTVALPHVRSFSYTPAYLVVETHLEDNIDALVDSLVARVHIEVQPA